MDKHDALTEGLAGGRGADVEPAPAVLPGRQGPGDMIAQQVASEQARTVHAAALQAALADTCEQLITANLVSAAALAQLQTLLAERDDLRQQLAVSRTSLEHARQALQTAQELERAAVTHNARLTAALSAARERLGALERVAAVSARSDQAPAELVVQDVIDLTDAPTVDAGYELDPRTLGAVRALSDDSA